MLQTEEADAGQQITGQKTQEHRILIDCLCLSFEYQTKMIACRKNYEKSIRFLHPDFLERLVRTWLNAKSKSGHAFLWKYYSLYLLKSMLPRLSLLYNKANKKKQPSFVDTDYEVAIKSEGLKRH